MKGVLVDPYAGRVLFLGIDAGGNSKDAWLDAEDVSDMDHKFMSREDVSRMVYHG